MVGGSCAEASSSRSARVRSRRALAHLQLALVRSQLRSRAVHASKRTSGGGSKQWWVVRAPKRGCRDRPECVADQGSRSCSSRSSEVSFDRAPCTLRSARAVGDRNNGGWFVRRSELVPIGPSA